MEFFYHEAMLSGYWIYIAAVLELAAVRQAAVAVALGEEPVRNS